MVTTHIELTEEQDRGLTELAKERGESRDALVRQAIDRLLRLSPGRPRSADLSERHDDDLNKDLGKSPAAPIPQAANKLVEPIVTRRKRRVPDDVWQRSFEGIGKLSSGLTDIAQRHDDYLNEDPGRGW